MKQRTEAMSIHGEMLAPALHHLAFVRSCWFEVEPEPDEWYRITVKDGEGHLDSLRNLRCGLAYLRQGPDHDH